MSPIDRWAKNKNRTTITRFGLVGGVRADTSPGITPVLDSDNVFPSPDGTEMVVRDAVEIRKRYRLTTDPVGYKALVAETAPPDVDLGYLFMIIDTDGGRNAIEKANFMRDRTQLPFETTVASVYSKAGTAAIDSSPPLIQFLQFPLKRVGFLDSEVSVGYQTFDGTAVAGVDYTASSGTVNFGINDVEETVVTSTNALHTDFVGLYFFVQIFPISPNVTTDQDFNVIRVSITP